MTEAVTGAVTLDNVRAATGRVAGRLRAEADRLTALDQATGDGDLGVMAAKVADELDRWVREAPPEAPGAWLSKAGMAVNRVAASTMGTLIATAIMRAGAAAKGRDALDDDDLARMLLAAEAGVRERGRAQPGDKTVVDALGPAARTFAEALGAGRNEAARRMLAAAREGREAVTPLRSRIGRAGWVGERTEGLEDPGCAAVVAVLEAIAAVDAL